VIGTGYAHIGHLFKSFQLGNVAYPSTHHLYVPTSFIFLSDRLNILMNARQSFVKSETLLQMFLYWSVITSSEGIARDYLHSPEIWAKAITMFQKDKLLGRARFGSIRVWLITKGRELEDRDCRSAVKFWLGPEAIDEEDNQTRTELLLKLRKMVTDLQGFYLEVDGLLVSRLPSDLGLILIYFTKTECSAVDSELLKEPRLSKRIVQPPPSINL